MSSEKLYWVGNGSILVTLKNKSKIKLFNGDEIKPEYLTEKEQADGIGPEFIKRHKDAGNISNNPLAGRVVSTNTVLQNRIVELQARVKELEGIIERQSKPAEPAKKGKAQPAGE